MLSSSSMKTLEQRLDGVTHVKIGGFDVDGVLRGKIVSKEKFFSALETGFGFCDVIFGWDVEDQLYDDGKDPSHRAHVTGWHTGYPDTLAILDPSTVRHLPWEPRTAACLADFRHEGKAHPGCGRSLLRGVLERYAAKGWTPKVAVEFEFWLFKETPESVRDKHYRGLTPISPGMFGYSWLREGQHQELMHAILDEMAAFDIPIEGFHTETGPGVYEVAIKYDDALASADKAALFKTCAKQICGRFGVIPTFMAKWSADLPGSGGHIHQSIVDASGKNLFAGDDGKLSELGRHYVGGVLSLMPALTAIHAPTVNSYRRYVPGVWAPLTASWGVENRTSAIRVIPAGPKSTRVEFRQTAADLHPYNSIAAVLAAGLHGIERRLEPPPMRSGDTSLPAPDAAPLPRTLSAATELLHGSAEARAILGDAFVDHYVRTRRHEVARFDRAVTDWELARYFEII